MHLTVQGLVLRVSPYNDSDAFLTILTNQFGRISAKVRGLRRKNSPLTAPCQLLSYAEFTLFEYKGVYYVNEANSLELFTGLHRDLQKLSLATYFAQAAELISQEDLPNPEMLSLVLNCFHALSKLDLPEAQVKAVFELRGACLAGYTPDLFGCHRCENQKADCFDISAGHLECSTCRDPSSTGIRMPLNAALLDAMRFICSCQPKRIFAFQMDDETLQQLSQITESYFCTQLERGFSTLDFYKTLIYQKEFPI